MQKITEEQQKTLIEARHNVGIYSLKEICVMFNFSRFSLDNALNEKKLAYISPNNRDRYIYLNDFLEFMQNERRAK